MSDTDSFIEEVSEEVRKDRLFQMYKRYGWIAAVVILTIVGGAAYLEYSKSKTRSAAQEKGDALISTLAIEDSGERSEALDELVATSGAEKALVLFQKAEGQLSENDKEGAIASLNLIKEDTSLDAVYTQMAALKAIMLQGKSMDTATRMLELEALSGVGAPYRILAMEQIAVAKIDEGNTDEAISSFIALLDEPGISAGMRNRVQQMIVALGGELPESGNLLSNGQSSQ